MARVPRRLSILAHHRVHKVWRGHNKEWNLKTTENKLKYLEFLNEDLESKVFDCGNRIQALTLMSNHCHEGSDIVCPKLYSNHMRRVHSRYGMYFNRLNNRSGKVAEDRPHTTLILGGEHEMNTTFYIHANPIRAGIVKDARNYRWSTHRFYAFGIREAWMRNIQLPDWYLRLGRTHSQRQREYRRLFARYLRLTSGRKLNFLKRRFYGPHKWMSQQEDIIKDWRKKLRAPP